MAEDLRSEARSPGPAPLPAGCARVGPLAEPRASLPGPDQPRALLSKNDAVTLGSKISVLMSQAVRSPCSARRARGISAVLFPLPQTGRVQSPASPPLPRALGLSICQKFSTAALLPSQRLPPPRPPVPEAPVLGASSAEAQRSRGG